MRKKAPPLAFVELAVRQRCFHPLRRNVEEKEEAVEMVQLTHIVVDCSSFPYIDLMGVDALARAHAEYQAINITVFFACCKGNLSRGRIFGVLIVNLKILGIQ